LSYLSSNDERVEGNKIKTIVSTCRNTETVLNKHHQHNVREIALKVVTNKGIVVRVGDGNIIRRFDKTPTPRKNTDVVCPHFSELAWGHGCPGHCDWCYLQGTFRWESYKTVDHSVPPKLKSREEIRKAVETFLDAKLKPHMLNSGELSDCYDAATEILTEEGWKTFDILGYGDKVATLSTEGKLEYQNPTHIIQELYRGKMLSISTKEIELVVTPNHKLWVSVRHYEPSNKTKEIFDPFHFERAEDVADKRMKMKKNASWIGQEQETFELPGNPNARYSRDRENIQIKIETWLEFFGYYLSEGSTYGNDIKHRYRVNIAQSKQENPEKYEKIKQCLMQMPITFHEFDDGFYCDSQHLAMYLMQFGQAEDKFIPKEIKKLSPRLLTILTDALVLGDGSCKGGDTMRAYYSCSKRLADDVQELLLKIGLTGNISIKQEPGFESTIKGRKITAKNTLYEVNITHRYLEPVIKHGHSAQGYHGHPHTAWIDYEGFIYCCTVPNHIVFVRHGGKPVWSGNSLMTERGKQPFSEFIMSFFKGTPHKVLFLTKMTDVQHFLENKWQKNAILAWSINATAVASRYEKRMPSPTERIAAAGQVYDAGYKVRVRLDPMVPVPDWPKHYGDIIECICDMFKPERVTLGTLRGLPSTIAAAKDKEWVKYLTESSNWGRKPFLETRLAMYEFAIKQFRSHGIRKIAVCKDTKQVWAVLNKKFGLNYHNMACNCLL
jgi:DNA repair photolyase